MFENYLKILFYLLFKFLNKYIEKSFLKNYRWNLNYATRLTQPT